MHNVPYGFGSLRISGDKASLFLQGQVTCDVSTILPGISCLAAHCTPQGRVISLFHLSFQDNTYLLTMPMDMIQLTKRALKKYAIFFNVKIDEVLPENEPNDIANINATTRENIEKSIPVIHPATSEKLLPQELNLDALGAISYDKGCYTGQEIIARIHYRGKTKSSLYRADIRSVNQPLAGDIIHTKSKGTSRECGIVIESCSISPEKYIALIVLEEAEIKNNTFTLTNSNDTITIYPRT